MNGHTFDITDKELVAVIDRAGITAASLMRSGKWSRGWSGMSRNEEAAWAKTIKRIIDSNRAFLTYVGSENRSVMHRTHEPVYRRNYARENGNLSVAVYFALTGSVASSQSTFFKASS